MYQIVTLDTLNELNAVYQLYLNKDGEWNNVSDSIYWKKESPGLADQKLSPKMSLKSSSENYAVTNKNRKIE